MSISKNEFEGLWRSSACEAVQYNKEFPEALLVLPEWIDGALGAGESSIINIDFDISDADNCKIIVEDNGVGLRGPIQLRRMLEWASSNVSSEKNENMFGHGSKKGLTKFCPDYRSAEWKINWRTKDRSGFSSSLNILSPPFLGQDTDLQEDVENKDICPGGGLRWEVIFKIERLGEYNTAKKLMKALQELIRTRYDPTYYQPYVINIIVKQGKTVVKDSSDKWKSLKQCLDDEVPNNKVYKAEFTHTVGKCTAHVSSYYIPKESKISIEGIERYGTRSMFASRVYFARNGRIVEGRKYTDFMGIKEHNSNNGTIVFITYRGECLPSPCTTKVSMQDNCPIFTMMNEPIKTWITATKPKASVTLAVPSEVVSKKETPKLLLKEAASIAGGGSTTGGGSSACGGSTLIEKTSESVLNTSVHVNTKSPIKLEVAETQPTESVVMPFTAASSPPHVPSLESRPNSVTDSEEALHISVEDEKVIENLITKYGRARLIEFIK